MNFLNCFNGVKIEVSKLVISITIFMTCLILAICGITSLVSVDEHSTYRTESLHLYLYVNFYLIILAFIAYITIITRFVPLIEPLDIFTLSRNYKSVRFVIFLVFLFAVIWGTFLMLFCYNRFGTALYNLTFIFNITSLAIISYETHLMMNENNSYSLVVNYSTDGQQTYQHINATDVRAKPVVSSA